MLKSVFFAVLDMSITASFAIAAVILIRFILRKQPKIYSYILWSAVLFRLICPWSVSLPFSAFSTIPPAHTQEGHIVYSFEEIIKTDENTPVEISAVDNMPAENRIVRSHEGSIDFALLASSIWLIGTMYVFSNNMLSVLQLKKNLANCKKTDDNIYTGNNISTAFVLGILSPAVYLPENISESQKYFILQHENIHIKRFDYLFKYLGFLALCIHWFNPLVWVAFRLAEKDMELSCDEAVIREMSDEDKRSYSMTVLQLSTCTDTIPQPAIGGGDVKERIKNIFSYKKPAFRFTVAISAAIALTVTALSVNPVSDSSSSGKQYVGTRKLYHVVSENDTLQSIAETYNTDVDQLYDMNTDNDLSSVSAGDILAVSKLTKNTEEDYSFWIKPDESKTVMAETAFSTFFRTLQTKPASDYTIENLTIINEQGENYDYIVIAEYISPSDKENCNTTTSMLYVKDNSNGNYSITGAKGAYSGEYSSVFIDENYEYTGSGLKFVWVTEKGRISRGFTGQYPSHNGMDIAGPVGTEIYAAADGTVTEAEELTSGNGIYCTVDHGGISTLYAHCSRLAVKEGDTVKKGDVIAYMGSTGNSTGPHVHFEVFDNKSGTRLDPYIFF